MTVLTRPGGFGDTDALARLLARAAPPGQEGRR